MTLRRRLIIASSAAVAAAVLLSSIVVYVVVDRQQYSQLNRLLRERVEEVRTQPTTELAGLVVGSLLPAVGPANPTDAGTFVQLVGDGRRRPSVEIGQPYLVNARTRAVAAGDTQAFFEDFDARGNHWRAFTAPLGGGFAVQAVRSLRETETTVRRLGLLLLLVSTGGIALAGLLGAVVARAALAPLRRLNEEAAQVAATTDLSHRLDAGAEDELGGLASTFNSMLDALQRSVASQRQLVADASHELRTPLTSLRTNLELVARDATLGPTHRVAVDDAMAQVEEVSALVTDVVELARINELTLEPEDVRLDVVTLDVVARMARHARGAVFEADVEPTIVSGVASDLERAVGNLLENAAKWSSWGGRVEVKLRHGILSVRDFGPGIPAADLEHVFERFYRASVAQSVPGSGLGLAIVKQIAEAHSADVIAANAAGGGALLKLTFRRYQTPGDDVQDWDSLSPPGDPLGWSKAD